MLVLAYYTELCHRPFDIHRCNWPIFEFRNIPAFSFCCDLSFSAQSFQWYNLEVYSIKMLSYILTFFFRGGYQLLLNIFNNCHWVTEWYFLCFCAVLPLPLLKNAILDLICVLSPFTLTWFTASLTTATQSASSVSGNPRTISSVASRFLLRTSTA